MEIFSFWYEIKSTLGIFDWVNDCSNPTRNIKIKNLFIQTRIKTMRNISIFLFIFFSAISCKDNSEGFIIELKFSQNEIIVGSSIVFSVVDNSGEDLTSVSNFYVDGQIIPSNSFSFNNSGEFDVYAIYNNITTETITITVNDPPIYFEKYVMVEDFTGTWCGWCPRVSYALEYGKEQIENLVVIANHYNDPMQNSHSLRINNLFGINSYPSVLINRYKNWNNQSISGLSVINSELNFNSTASVALESSLTGNNLYVKAKLKMGENFDALTLGVMLLEDGLVRPQSNYTSYYGGFNPVTDFVHNDILRDYFTNVLGHIIPDESIGHGKVFEKEFNIDLSSYDNIQNLRLVAFVSNRTNRKIINVRSSSIDENQDFNQIN